MAAYLLYITSWQSQNEDNVFFGRGGEIEKLWRCILMCIFLCYPPITNQSNSIYMETPL
jgi:hypothetical protein